MLSCTWQHCNRCAAASFCSARNCTPTAPSHMKHRCHDNRSAQVHTLTCRQAATAAGGCMSASASTYCTATVHCLRAHSCSVKASAAIASSMCTYHTHRQCMKQCDTRPTLRSLMLVHSHMQMHVLPCRHLDATCLAHGFGLQSSSVTRLYATQEMFLLTLFQPCTNNILKVRR